MKLVSTFFVLASVFLFAGCTQKTVKPEVAEPAQVAPTVKVAPKTEVGEIPQIPVVDRTGDKSPTAPPPPPPPPILPTK